MKPEIPTWIGKISVPEGKETTVELLETWAKLLNEEVTTPELSLDARAFLKTACDVANVLEQKLHEKHPKFKPPEWGIWVGYPETPVGRLNSRLVGRVSSVHHFLTK